MMMMTFLYCNQTLNLSYFWIDFTSGRVLSIHMDPYQALESNLHPSPMITCTHLLSMAISSFHFVRILILTDTFWCYGPSKMCAISGKFWHFLESPGEEMHPWSPRPATLMLCTISTEDKDIFIWNWEPREDGLIAARGTCLVHNIM